MRQLMLDALECHKTEDSFGADECRLEIAVDGVLQPHMKKSLNDGQTWSLNGSYAFRHNTEVKLWDEDSPDSDDFLGGVIIGPSVQTNAIASFNGDGARYQLTYRVFDLTEPIVDPVEEALRGFEESTQSGVWPYILKAELLGDIRRTVANPFNVAQERTDLCGPAAIIFELVTKQPSRYVNICRALYETGEFTSRTKIVRPSSTLLTSRVPSDITLADWMLMACLRDTENALFPVEASSSPIAMGITTPWEMKGWVFEILGYDTAEFESTAFYAEFEAMRKAEAARNQGGVPFSWSIQRC